MTNIDQLRGLQAKRTNSLQYRTIQKLWPELAEKINALDLCSFREKLDYFLSNQPKRALCRICSKPVLEWIVGEGWRDTCSQVCAVKATCLDRYGVTNGSQSNQARISYEKTCLERYGVANATKDPKIQKKISEKVKASKTPEVQEKTKATCLERYGVEHPSQLESIKEAHRATNLKRYGVESTFQVEKFKAKTKATNLKRYGVEYPMQSKEIWKHYRKTCLERYGVEYPSQSEEIKAKVRKTCLQRYGVMCPLWDPAIQAQVRKTCKELYGKNYWNEHDKETKEKLKSRDFWQREYFDNGKSIEQLAGELGVNASGAIRYFYDLGFNLDESRSYYSAHSKGELEVLTFINQFIAANSLRLPNGKSLDIYVPELHLAFEYNGLYWHSEKHRDSKYHLEKTLECENLGIRLIHIWEDDWLFKEDLMKRKIKALLGFEERKIFARKCSIVIPTIEQKRSFYKANHIKGLGGSGSVNYALEYQHELIAMITFKKNPQGWDLNRFATSCSVPGGFSRLLEYFKRNNTWSRIYTFADRSWSQGNVYLKTGFKLVETLEPNYSGLENYRRNHRRNYIHELLHKRFPDLHGTQFEIMDQAGILRIWDCGQLKFELLNT